MDGQTLVFAAEAAQFNTGDAAWMLVAASLVLLMTPALALFYGGMSRQKSVLNMMMMSFGAAAVVGIIYVFWGWSMSYGGSDIVGIFGNPFEVFGLTGVVDNLEVPGAGNYPEIIDVGFQVTFAIITVALISGALAERVRFSVWLLFAGVWVTIVYFPLAHMVWGEGFLSGSADGLAAKIFGTVTDSAGETAAAIAPVDFAGGTVVHINAGIAALFLAIIIGKRVGFGKVAYRPHNLPFVMLGAGLLWFGWFGFNAGSAFGANSSAGLAWVNTTTATCAAMLGWMVVERVRDSHATSLGAASGIVAGLVAITPAAGSVSPLGAIVVGAIAGILSAYAVGLKYKLGFDDSLDVVGVHLVSGLWGTLSIGLLATGTFDTAPGIFYSLGDGWKLLIVQIAIAVVALAFTSFWTVLIAICIKRTIGWRVGEDEERSGIDEETHGETAYDISQGLGGQASLLKEKQSH